MVRIRPMGVLELVQENARLTDCVGGWQERCREAEAERDRALVSLGRLVDEKDALAKRGPWRWEDYDALLTEITRLRAGLERRCEEADRVQRAMPDPIHHEGWMYTSEIRSLLAGSGVSEAEGRSE